MQSAIASQPIFHGAAVSLSKDNATLAGSAQATHIVTSGAPARGIVSLTASGDVFLDDWTLATGSSRLITGQTYYAAPGGKLSTSGSQPVGIATSPNILSVLIQNSGTTTTMTNLASLQAQVNALQAQLSNLTNQLNSANAAIQALQAERFILGEGGP